MPTKSTQHAPDAEIAAITVVYGALAPLQPEAQLRVIEYVMGKLGLSRSESAVVMAATPSSSLQPIHSAIAISPDVDTNEASVGVSPIAQKWMQRNGLSAAQLTTLFSLGSEEVDLIAKTVPGKSMRQRMHNVLLLLCVASYLSGGAPRVSHEKLKETCLHYDAFDSPNFAAHLKNFSSEVTGTKQSGYTLTQRGLAAATDLIQQISGTLK